MKGLKQSAEFWDLGSKVNRQRGAGRVILLDRWWETPPSRQEVKEWLFHVGLTKIHSTDLPTLCLDRDGARELLTRNLERDLAYQVVLMPHVEALALAEAYLNLLPADAEIRSPLFSSDLTDATFDTGILSLHPTHSTVFWFLDED